MLDSLSEADKQYRRAVELIGSWSIEEQYRVIFSWMGYDNLKEMNNFLESKAQAESDSTPK